MADRCSFKGGGRRCSRNGTGSPVLCRAHKIHNSVEEDSSGFLDLLGLADDVFRPSNEEFTGQVGKLFGAFLTGAAVYEAAKAGSKAGRGSVTSPQPEATPVDNPRRVLGFEPAESLSKESIKTRKRELAKVFHPDKPMGSVSAMKRVNEAADALLKEL